ncbi:sulfite exporter TauE/SafE family protein [Streptomyces microflavus]|uniref:sulfite exporter TauE/SafE family protein n=1 Tax=Streptomyces microflavus TaxID=1919 RepID=UPI002255CA5F|nr:sulfite exporter TauE/SafE family protein [Streptomyces microflavus]MCX4657576.1 sulfite exporter TauE/SafE family protein [Streptomyces microflavus]
MTQGLSLRELDERFEYGRTQWGQFRRGSKILPGWLVESLVKNLVTSPQKQRLELHLGRELQKAAETAAVSREAQSGIKPTGTEGELQIRLDEARKTTIEAQKTLLGATQIIYMLLGLVTSLQSRCQVLEKERDSAAARPDTGDQAHVLAVVEHELSQTKQKADLVEQKLDRARRTRHEAEDLHVTAEISAVRHELALEEIRTNTSSAPEEQDMEADTADSSAAGASAVVEALTPLWEYDAALEAVDQQMEAREAELDDLRTQMGVESPRQDDGVLSGVVVREQPADNEGTQAEATAEVTSATSDSSVAKLTHRRWTELFTPRPDGPQAISEQTSPERGRICLGPLYVPKIPGIRLHAGIRDGKLAGLIAEVEDHQFEIQVFPGSFRQGSWKAAAKAARRQLEEYGAPVDFWHGTDRLLPLRGPALATRHGVRSRTPDGEKHQVIIMGRDGPGWVFQLTWYRPEDSTTDEHAIDLLSSMLQRTVIDPLAPREEGAFLFELPKPHQGPPPATTPVIIRTPHPSPPPNSSTSSAPNKQSTVSADNADTSPTSGNTSPAPKTAASSERPQRKVVTRPAWVMLKDAVLTLTFMLWSTSLASGLTYRRWDGIGAAQLTLTIAWALFLFLVSAFLYLAAVMLIGNSTKPHVREVRVMSETHMWIILIGLFATCGGILIGLTDPRVFNGLNVWGQVLSATLLH